MRTLARPIADRDFDAARLRREGWSLPYGYGGVVRTVIRSPGRPKMLRISAGSSPVLPNQCGTLVSNAGDLARPEHPVLVAENETHVPGQDVDPFVAVVRPRLWGDLAGRDDDLPGLHPIGLPGQRDHRPALDATGLELDARIALLGRRDEVVQRHPIGMRQREEQLQGGPPLSGLEPRHACSSRYRSPSQHR